MMSTRIMPKLQEAPDGMPKVASADRALTFLVNDHGGPFASAGAFGNKFAAKPRNAGQAV
jgi:hypothetical protein